MIGQKSLRTDAIDPADDPQISGVLIHAQENALAGFCRLRVRQDRGEVVVWL